MYKIYSTHKTPDDNIRNFIANTLQTLKLAALYITIAKERLNK